MIWAMPTGNQSTARAQEPGKVQPTRAIKIIDRENNGHPLRFPSGLAYDESSDEIYVTSPQKNKVVVYTSDYFPYLSLGAGRGLHAVSKAFIKDGLLYVCVGASMGEARPHIAVFDGAFLPVKKIYFSDFPKFSPLDVVIGNTGNLYVVGLNGTGVLVLDTEGNYLRTIQPRDEVLGSVEKAPILALDIGSDGRLYFVSESMGRVYVYDASEKFLFKFGEKGGEPGKLSRPRGIAVDDRRRQIYLVDYQRHTIPVYSIEGEYLFEIGGLGTSRGWFHYPMDVEVDGSGRLLVADGFNHRVQVLEFVSKTPPAFAPAEAMMARAEPEIPTIVIPEIEVSLPEENEGNYLVMTAMTQSKEDADALMASLHKKDYPAFVHPVEINGMGTWHQLLVGPFVEPLEAYDVAEKIKKQENLPAILKTRGARVEIKLPAEHSPGEAAPSHSEEIEQTSTSAED